LDGSEAPGEPDGKTSSAIQNNNGWADSQLIFGLQMIQSSLRSLWQSACRQLLSANCCDLFCDLPGVFVFAKILDDVNHVAAWGILYVERLDSFSFRFGGVQTCKRWNTLHVTSASPRQFV